MVHYKRQLYNLLCLICFIRADSCFERKNKNRLRRSSRFDSIEGPLIKKRKLDFAEVAQKLDFAKEIQKLREAADQKRGIKWQLAGDTLVRDATEASYHDPHTGEDYMVIIINSYRAGAKIALLYGKDACIFKEEAVSFIEEYKTDSCYNAYDEKFWIEKVKTVNSEIVSLLKRDVFPYESLDVINTRLRQAENYVGLDDVHYNVTTKFKVKNKIFGLEDKKWLKLTSAQQEEFQNKESKNWYSCLDDFEKKLVNAYASKFVKGTHYIPTQIRSLPGCRNAYKKSVLAYDAKGNAVVLGNYYHSGTLVSFSKDSIDKKRISQHNWEQVNAHANNVMLMILNTSVDLPITQCALEKDIVKQTRVVVDEKKLMYMPINVFGIFAKPFFKDHIDQLLVDSRHYYAQKYPGKVMDGSCMTHKNQKDSIFFKKLEKLKEIASNSDGENTLNRAFSNNHYADIGADYIACRSVLNQYKKEANPSVLFSCKSGKDRTGYVSYLADAAIIHIMDPTIGEEAEVRSALATGAHAQFLSSLNGGMPGRFGMKPVASNFGMMTVGSITKSRFTGIDKKLFALPALLTKISLK